MKTWCSHITHWSRVTKPGFELRAKDWAGHAIIVPVPRSWKMCPICGAERPTRANIKAATLRASHEERSMNMNESLEQPHAYPSVPTTTEYFTGDIVIPPMSELEQAKMDSMRNAEISC